MKSKSVFAAAALVALFGSAHASDISADMADGSAAISRSIAAVGSFADVYTFSLASSWSTFDSTVFSFKQTNKDIDFSSITLAGPVSGSFFQVGSDPTEQWWLSLPALPAGLYTLTLAGTKAGSAVATYSGTLELAAAVPEPETYAMMLAGLGVVGFVASRRRIGR